MHEVRETQADAAKPEDTERTVGEIVRVPRRDRGFPRACVQGTFRFGKVAESGEDEVEGCGGGSFVDGAGGVGDADAWQEGNGTELDGGRTRDCGRRRRSLTFLFTRMHVDEIVPCPIMCNPLHARRESCNEFAIIYPDSRCGDVAPVDSDGAFVWPTGLEPGKELGAVGRIVHLDRRP